MKIFTTAIILALSFFSGSLHAGEEGIAVIVNINTNIENIRPSQVRNAFMGKIAIKTDQGLLVPIDLKQESEVRKKFYKVLAGKDTTAMKKYWSAVTFSGKGVSPVSIDGAKKVKALIRNDPQLIGYINIEDIDNSVKKILVIR